MAFRRQNAQEKYVASIPDETWIETETTEERIIDMEVAEERQKFINKILSILTPRQKEIVYYRYFTGLTLEEISQQENMDYHSVANVIQRAIKKIKKIYSKSD